VSSIFRSACILVQGLVVAKFLGAAAFGIFSIASSFIALVFGIFDFKIAESVIKFIPELERERSDGAVRVATFVFLTAEGCKGLLAFLVVVIGGYFLANDFYRQPILFGTMSILAIGHLFAMLNPTLTAYLRLSGWFKIIAVYDLAYGAVFFLGTTVVVYATHSLQSLVWAYAVAGVVGGLTKTLICLVVLKPRIDPRQTWHMIRNWHAHGIEWKKIVLFSFDINLSATFRYIARNLDILLLGKLAPAGMVGSYSLAKKIGNLFAYLTDPVPIVIYPEMTRRWAEGKIHQVVRIFKKTTIFSVLGCAAFYMMAASTADWIVPFVFGAGYTQIGLLLWFFFPGALFTSGFFLIYHLVMTMGKSRLILYSSIINFAGIIFLVPVLTLLFSSSGAAIAVSMATVLSYAYVIVKIRPALSAGADKPM